MKQYIYSSQSSLWGEPELLGFGSNEFYIKEIDRNLANDIIVKNHYSKKFYNATYIHLGLFVNEEIKGVLQYGYAMNPASCGSVVEGTQKDEYLELNRMWIADNVGEYPESRAISYSLKYIRRKYPKIKWIQSFADERCGGFGIVYQACSFDYYGEHKSDFWELDGQVYHNIQMTVSKDSKRYAGEAKYLQENKDKAIKMTLRQFRYIKFLDQREKKKCLLKQEQYPKYYATT
jgi:adenine modification enzyme